MRVYLIAATTALVAAPAWAADTIPTPTPEPVYHSEMRGTTHVADGDWSGVYVKGQVGYVWPAIRGVSYVTGSALGTNIASFATHSVDNTWTAGVGAGYQINRYLRTELMFDYIFDSDFTGTTFGSCGVAPSCVSTDLATWNAYSLIASVYVDLDFWGHGSAWGHFVPYVGGGIGGSYVNWSDLANTSCQVNVSTNCDQTFYHEGGGSWRFAWEVGAGGSYYFRCDFAAEAGYKYRRIEGGDFFGIAAGAGPGWDSGFSAHMVNAGLRFYPGRDCDPPYEPPYVPPVYK